LKLFDRTTRRVVLTNDAAQFKTSAESLLREFDNLIGDLRAIAQSQRGHVRIAALPSMIMHILTPALTTFRNAYPHITISVSDGGADKIERIVLDGVADFGISSRLNNYPELDYVPMLLDSFGAIFPHDHPLAQSSGPLRWSELAAHQYIALTNDTGIGAFLNSHPDLGFREKDNPHDRASSTTSLYAMLSLGGKFSVLPALAAQAGPLKQFKFRELYQPTITWEICLITRRLRSQSANTRQILDALIGTIRKADNLNGARTILDGKLKGRKK